MPLTAQYSWSETKDVVRLAIPLKSSRKADVDVYVSDVFVKVNFAPYILMLDLVAPVDDLHAVARFDGPTLELELQKLVPGLWKELLFVGDKRVLRERREASMQAKSKRDAELRKRKGVVAAETERKALRSQMALEESERQHLDDVKAEEKAAAEEEVYRTLAEVQRKTEPADSLSRAGAAEAGAARSTGSEKLSATEPAAQPSHSKISTPSRSSHGVSKQDTAIFTDVPEDVEEDDIDEEVEYVPPPRRGLKQTIAFSERVFPTPLRESKVAEEEAWVEKNREGLIKRGRIKEKDPKARDISERDPLWLKGRGDDFFRAGDYRSALNAYSAAIEADPEMTACISNRAACNLQLGRPDDCVEDCNLALMQCGLSDSAADFWTEASEKQLAMAIKLLVRRGTAQCQQARYEAALVDYQSAHSARGHDEMLRTDVERLQKLVACATMKAEGDAAFRAGDIDTAIDKFTSVLTIEPNFVSCISNRAAVYMHKGELARCVADCTAALQLLSPEHGDTECSDQAKPTGPIPVAGSKKHAEWLLKTIVRRGTARVRLGELDSAAKDFEDAHRLAPTDAALAKDLHRIQARLAQ